MLCKACHSARKGEFPAEINIHFPGMENLTEPTLFVFPTVSICFDCGFTEFSVSETELPLLHRRHPTLT